MCWLAFLLAGGCVTSSTVVRATRHFPEGTGFIQRTILVDQVPRRVWVFVPANYSPDRGFPAVMFLHGLFEAGRNSNACLSSGLAPVIARRPDDWPFITIFPQSDGTWKGEARERLVLAALDDAQANWSIDPDRVCLAGLSYGGLGTWEIGARHPDRFAALVPVSGPSAIETVARVALLPVWAFHYTGDLIIASRSSEEMCRRIDSAGGRAKLTEFSGVGHDCWDKAVEESQLVPWLLEQRRQPIDRAALPNTSAAMIEQTPGWSE